MDSNGSIDKIQFQWKNIISALTSHRAVGNKCTVIANTFPNNLCVDASIIDPSLLHPTKKARHKEQLTKPRANISNISTGEDTSRVNGDIEAANNDDIEEGISLSGISLQQIIGHVLVLRIIYFIIILIESYYVKDIRSRVGPCLYHLDGINQATLNVIASLSHGRSALSYYFLIKIPMKYIF